MGDGTPLGLINQVYWSRSKTLDLWKYQVWQRNQERPFEDKEPAHFVRCAQHAIERLRNKGVHPWIIIDREADNRDILLALSNADCVFTVRASYDRYLATPKGCSLRAELQQQPLLGSYDVLVGRTGNRPARRAVVEVRAQRLELLFRARLNKSAETLGVTAVWVHEKTDDPKAALDWILYTNAPVTNDEQARCIVEAYRARWRIEEFHRTWKQGECNVEDAQLRSLDVCHQEGDYPRGRRHAHRGSKYSSRTNPDEVCPYGPNFSKLRSPGRPTRSPSQGCPAQRAPACRIRLDRRSHELDGTALSSAESANRNGPGLDHGSCGLNG